MNVWPWPPIFHYFFLVFLRLKMNHKNDSNHMFFSNTVVQSFVRFGDLWSLPAAVAAALHNTFAQIWILIFCVYAKRIWIKFVLLFVSIHWHLRKWQSPQVIVMGDVIIADHFYKMSVNMENNKLRCNLKRARPEIRFHNTFFFLCGSAGTLASIWIFDHF